MNPETTLSLREALHEASNPQLMAFRGSIYIHLHRERPSCPGRNTYVAGKRFRLILPKRRVAELVALILVHTVQLHRVVWHCMLSLHAAMASYSAGHGFDSRREHRLN
jgi:hypothetical protein